MEILEKTDLNNHEEKNQNSVNNKSTEQRENNRSASMEDERVPSPTPDNDNEQIDTDKINEGTLVDTNHINGAIDPEEDGLTS